MATKDTVTADAHRGPLRFRWVPWRGRQGLSSARRSAPPHEIMAELAEHLAVADVAGCRAERCGRASALGHRPAGLRMAGCPRTTS